MMHDRLRKKAVRSKTQPDLNYSKTGCLIWKRLDRENYYMNLEEHIIHAKIKKNRIYWKVMRNLIST